MATAKQNETVNVIIKYFEKDNTPRNAINLFLELVKGGYGGSIQAIRSSLKTCLKNQYVKVHGTEGYGMRKAIIYVLGPTVYIHKDDEYYREQEAQKAEYEETKYSLICSAW